MKQYSLLIFMSLFLSFAQACQSQSATLKSVSAAEFKRLIDKNSVTLIDVRSSGEFLEGHIMGAKNIDVNSTEFTLNVKKIANKKPLALYCRSGHRSKQAAAKLSDVKIVIYNLNSGMSEWIQASYPITKK